MRRHVFAWLIWSLVGILHICKADYMPRPQLGLHQGHIQLQENLHNTVAVSNVVIGGQYTFEIIMMDTTSYDYEIESCVLNGQERFMLDHGCLHCTNTFLKVWETEKYGGAGSVKRTLVYLNAPSSQLNFECSIRVYRCCACAERSCVTRPLLGMYPCETVKVGMTAGTGGYASSRDNYGLGFGGYSGGGGYVSKDHYAGSGGYVVKDSYNSGYAVTPFAGYIAPPVAPHDSETGIIGGAVAVPSHSSGWWWGLPWWAWLLILLLLLLLLLCLIALCLWLCCRGRGKRKGVSTVVTPGIPPPKIIANSCSQTDMQNMGQITTVEETKVEIQEEHGGNGMATLACGGRGGHQSRYDREEQSGSGQSGYYNVNTGQTQSGHYRKNRSRSPHHYNGYGEDFCEKSSSTMFTAEDQYRADYRADSRAEYRDYKDECNADYNDRYRQDYGYRRSNSSHGYHPRETSTERAYRTDGYNRSNSIGMVNLAGGYDELTRTNNPGDYNASEDDYVVERDVKTTTTTKYIEERRVIDEDGDDYSGASTSRLRGPTSTTFGTSAPRPSPSEENFREETVQHAVYAHSVPV